MSTEQKQSDLDQDVVTVQSHKQKMLKREICKWGHISFRWEIQLTDGDIIEGPHGKMFKVIAKDPNVLVTLAKNESICRSKIKSTIDTFDTFWCEEALIYASASAGMVNLKKTGYQGTVLHNINAKRFRERQIEQQTNKKTIIMGTRYDPEKVDPFLIQDNE